MGLDPRRPQAVEAQCTKITVAEVLKRLSQSSSATSHGTEVTVLIRTQGVPGPSRTEPGSRQWPAFRNAALDCCAGNCRR